MISLHFSQIKSHWISSLSGCVVIVRRLTGPDMLHKHKEIIKGANEEGNKGEQLGEINQ